MADSFLFGITPFIDNMSKKQVGKQPTVKKIDKNGKYNVQDVEIVKVEVPGGTGPAPTGTKKIIANGNGIDVAKFAKVDVNVPTGITPSGTKQITENGEGIDVAEFATVNVNVPTGPQLLTPNCDFGIFMDFDPWTEPNGFEYYSSSWHAAAYHDIEDGSYYFALERSDGRITTYESNTLIIDGNGVIQPGYGEGTTVKLILPILSPVTIVGGTSLGTFIFGIGEHTSEEVQNYNVEFYTMDNIKIGDTMRLGDCFGGNGC